MGKPIIESSYATGFSFAFRHPVSAAVWALLLIVTIGAAGWLIIGGVAGDMPAQLRQNRMTPGAMPDPATTQYILGLYGAIFLFALVAAIPIAIVQNAVHRTIIHPDRRAFFALRFGMDEVRTYVINLIIGIMFFIATIILIVAAAIPTIGMAAGARLGAIRAGDMSAVSGMMGGLLLFYLLVLIGSILLAVTKLKLQMAVPMSLAEGRFRLFEAWGMTKGYSWPLLGTAVLLGVTYAVSFVVLYCVSAIAGVAGFARMAAIGGAGQTPEIGTTLVPLVIMCGILFLYVCFIAPFMISPYARAYTIMAGSNDRAADES